MCGIIGYIGKQKAEPILINGLLRLEYRGYDSAGISTLEGNIIKTIKNKGRIQNLLENKEIENLTGTMGIGHTRWATHGEPSAINSHPHHDNSNNFSVVHNGIIENYQELKTDLINKGYKFLSQTDTEIIPNLIHYNFTKYLKEHNLNERDLNEENAKDIILAVVNKTAKALTGSYAIEVISTYLPNSLIVLRKDSPLVIGQGLGENYISSDIPAILSFTKDFYLLNNNESAYITRDTIEFYDEDLNKIQKEKKNIAWDMSAAEKDGYDDYMLKEIFEQPKAIRETIGSRISDEGIKIPEFDFTKEYLQSLKRIYFVACGTAMHAGLAAKSAFEKFLKIQTEVDIASEFRYRDPLIDDKTLCFFISQSGETADTLAAMHLAKEKGAKTIAITNVIGSSISRDSDYCVYTHAGPEIAVASTKAYTSQIALLTVVVLKLAEIMGNNDPELETLKSELISIPSKIDTILKKKDEIKEFAHQVYKEKNMFFIGRMEDYAAAQEGSLKVKEISYIHSESYASGELKHGAIALIESGVTVVSVITNPLIAPKTLSNVQEVITRGAKTFVVTSEKLENLKIDKIIEIPKTSKYISPILSVVPLQLYAYYISKEKGLDVDKPRNLAKSVTVE